MGVPDPDPEAEADVVVGAVVDIPEDDAVETGIEDVEVLFEEAVVPETRDEDFVLLLLLTDVVAVPGTHW